MTAVFYIILSIFCIYLVYLHNRSLQAGLYNINLDCQKYTEQLNLLINKDNNLKERNRQLEQGLNETVTIYEYVKKLGSTMDFTEAVSALENTLTALSSGSRGKLVLIENQDIRKAYSLSQPEAAGLKEYEKTLALSMAANPKTILYEKGKLSSLGRFPNDIERLFALPLMSENQLLGIIILENLPLAISDKIHFIALQFAMEVKKTQLYEKIKELSTIDGLTGLYLRRHFMELLANELDRGYRQNQPLSILMIDVDYFKRYNDEYGHLAGDFILKEIGRILKEKSREIDLLCRYGGDEFALALPRTTIEAASVVADRLRRAVNEYLFNVAKEQFQVTVSVGVSSCKSKDMQTAGIIQTVIDASDKALYQAKADGRNRIVGV